MNNPVKHTTNVRNERRHAVMTQRAEELRSGAVAVGEQKQQEKDRLDLGADVDGELAHQEAREQGPGDKPDRMAAELDLSEQIAKRQSEKERDLGVIAKDLSEAFDHGSLPLSCESRTAKIAAVDQPRRSVPLMAVSGPSRRHSGDGSMSP